MRKILLVCGVLLLTLQAFAQRTVTGTVTDEKGNPLSNVSVFVKGTNTGVVTKENGTYSITLPANARFLVFSSVDMVKEEKNVTTGSVFNVVLKGDEKTLTDVVVTGYGTKRRVDFTGASSKVAAKQIEQVPIASFEQILQGRAPGLYIASGSGQPGASARVNIRGVGSISGGNTPLYVLDGVPIEEGVFRTLNPNDFESVDVLKDAAGAGLYGSRGANGVIVITSKKGRAGKTLIQYRGSYGVSQVPKLLNLEMMNTSQRLEYEEKLLGPSNILPVGGGGLTGYPGWDYSPNNPRYAGLTQTQKDAEKLLLDSIRKIDTDWADIMTRNAKFQQHEVSASGGSQGLSFFTSLSYYKQEGIIIRSDLERYTFRTNLDFKKDRLTISIRSAAGFSKFNNIESEAGVALANAIAAAYLELPYRRPFLPNGKNAVGTGNTGANAYDRLFTTTSLTSQFKGNLAITAQFDIWNGISFKTTNGVDWRNNNSSRFIDPNSFAGGLVAQGAQGSYNEGNSENLQLISTTGLVFSKTLKEKHAVNASAMVEGIRNRGRNFNATGFGLNLRLPNTPAAITAGSATNNLIPLVGGGRTLNGLFSYFATVDYTYNKRYTFSGVVRRDAPSQVPETNRNNVFYAVAGSWNIAAEKFMEKQQIFQDARLRVSYGETANANGFNSNFGYISTYGPLGGGYAGVPAIIPTSPGNLDYKLESQVQTNFGLELGMWNRRARVTLDYYIKDSRNLFVDQNLTRTSGFTSLATNAAKMRNQGFEFKADVDVVSKGSFVVTVGANGAFNKNEIKSLGLLTEIPQGTGIIRVGLPLGSHFVVGYLGVDPQSGLPIYEDINGNPTNIYSAANNKATYGSFIPKFTGGANLDVSWKGFALSALFSTAQGVKRFNNESFFYETTNSNVAFNKRVDMLTSWTKPGDNTTYQRIASQRQFSSKDVRDASFVRFRNLTLGYTFTPKNQKYFRSVRLYGQGQNLYTWTKWTGFDPEESNNIATYEFPNPRTYTVGLDINF
jgi:TonB-linked SusC/RagA family outer membrane protein